MNRMKFFYMQSVQLLTGFNCEFYKTSSKFLNQSEFLLNGSKKRAINLALKMEEKKKCTVNCFTSTIVLEDDLIPLMDHLDISFQHRHLSAVHIKITPNY